MLFFLLHRKLCFRYEYSNLGPPQITVLNLPWEEVNRAACEALGPINHVIAADVVFDKDLFEHLIGALNKLLTFCSVQSFIFACTVRNPETLNNFKEKIGKFELITYS